MKMTTMKASFPLFVLALGACNLGKSMTEDEFCKEYGKRECAKVAGYCEFTASSCEPLRVTACQQMAAASKTGSRKFNADNADRCLDQVNKTYGTIPIMPPQLDALDRACSRVFSGAAKANEACTVDFDCDGDLVCDKGRCGAAKVVASGGGCANVGETCPKGEYCTNSTGLYQCTRKQAAGATCSDSQPCVETLRCTGTCTARAEVGATCASDDECASGYCTPYPAPGTPRKCSSGLSFAAGSTSCQAYMGTSPDGGTSD
jgi:hypothetical protein